MAITHTTAARDTISDAVTALIDSGGAGKLRITTSAPATLVEITFGATAFGNSSVGVCTVNGLPLEGTASGTGVAAICKLINGSSTDVITGTVTATGGGGDLTLVSTTITSGEVVRLTAGTYTAPP